MSDRDLFTEYVARVLDAERVAHRLSVDDLATSSGIPRRTLYRILNAERDINVHQMEQLAAVFNTPPSAIFAEAERRMARASPDPAIVEQVLAETDELSEAQKDSLRAQTAPPRSRSGSNAEQTRQRKA